jgi:hypothetical protein
MGFMSWEADELSKLPRKNRALREMSAYRDKQQASFFVRNAKKVGEGRWRSSDTAKHWKAYLWGWYRRNGLCVKLGAVGKQQKIPVGFPNVWEWYRRQLRITPDSKAFVSPWQQKQIKSGKTPLDRGQIFIQSGKASSPYTGSWLLALSKKIAHAKNSAERTMYTNQYNRLAKAAGRETR